MKHNSLRRLAASLIGLTFIVSGLLKLLDPVGTGLIVSEYLKFFHMSFLGGMAKGLGVALCLLETLTGAALITGVYRKLAAIVAGSMMSLFTVITLILLIANPNMDCGCFGEAIHLTHLQSFLKNIVLLLLACLAFIPFRQYGECKAHRRVAFWIGAVSIVAAMCYSLTRIPVVDFTDFRPGAELYASLDNDYQAMDGYYAAYIYEKDGQRGSFTLDRLPDSTWTFVEVDTVFRNSTTPLKTAPVLSFSDSQGNYQDELAVQGKVVVISVYNPRKCDWDRVGELFARVNEANDVAPIVLVNSSPAEMENLAVPPYLKIFYADYKTLITLNRANGGATYIADGEIVRKWHPRYFPGPEGLAKVLRADVTDTQIKSESPGRIRAQGFALYLLAVLFFL